MSDQRHRTLRAAIDWSYQLLDEPQRRVFDRLSVFVGPFALDAAERVAGDRDDPTEIGDVVATLVDRSILDARPERTPTRYSMLETLRRFGATKRGDLDAADLLAQRGLGLVAPPDPIRRYGLFVLGDVTLFDGRRDESSRCYAEAARLAEDAGDRYTHTYSLANLAFPLAYRGESDRALAAAQRGRSVAAASGSPHLVAWADYALGEVLADTDPEQAMVALDAALAAAKKSGSRFIEGWPR